jgi:(1->4)-alpha-D-glucan 1-alpha-D-glucosylmutase
MNATSTHDTKRSEDVRARIHVLSEVPDLWERELRKWSRTNASWRDGIPGANEEWLIYRRSSARGRSTGATAHVRRQSRA